MPLFRVTTLEWHLYEVTYDYVEADTAADAEARVRECGLDYDSKSVGDNPGEVESVLSVEPVEEPEGFAAWYDRFLAAVHARTGELPEDYDRHGVFVSYYRIGQSPEDAAFAATCDSPYLNSKKDD